MLNLTDAQKGGAKAGMRRGGKGGRVEEEAVEEELIEGMLEVLESGQQTDTPVVTKRDHVLVFAT